MLVTPNTFPTQNNHRIALFQPDIARTDFDRIEDIGADAISSARSALEHIELLSHATLKPIDGYIRTIRTCAEQRRVLTDDFRHAASCILRHFARENCSGDSHGDHDLPIRYLRDSLNHSNRVQDLLAAEREIGRSRGWAET